MAQMMIQNSGKDCLNYMFNILMDGFKSWGLFYKNELKYGKSIYLSFDGT
jgi:hypothetical protein